MNGKQLATLHSRFVKYSEPYLSDIELLELEKGLREIENYMHDMNHNIEASWFIRKRYTVKRYCKERNLEVLK